MNSCPFLYLRFSAKPLRRFVGLSLLVLATSASAATGPASAEAIIKGYFSGWEKKDWNTVAAHLAEGFTFTSPAPDDHLDAAQFQAKCWNQAAHIRRFELPRIVGDEREAFALVQVLTTDGRVIRNIEYFTFRDGKIATIEVFFGGSGQGFPTNTK